MSLVLSEFSVLTDSDYYFRVATNLENLELSGNLRYGQGIFYDMPHGSRLAYR